MFGIRIPDSAAGAAGRAVTKTGSMSGPAGRWDGLFADLEAQLAAQDVAERAVEVGERARIEFGATDLRRRLVAAVGAPLRFEVLGGLSVAGTLERVGADWALCDEGGGREALVALAALRLVHGLGRISAPPGSDGAVAARLTLRSALRGIARDRSAVRLHTVDGSVVEATLDRTGSDFVEVARHAPAEARRRGQVRDVVLVPLAAIAVVHRQVG